MPAKHVRLFDLSALFWVALLVAGLFFYGGKPEDALERRQSFQRGVDNVLGNMGLSGLVSQYGGVYEDPEMTERIDTIFNTLVVQAQSDRDDLEYTITLLDSDTPNAFALPGGSTFITRGLVELLDDDDEIAGVLGHELVHTVKSHGSSSFGRDLGLLLAYDFVLGQVDPEERARAAEIAQLSHALISTGYSRSAESEADKFGLHYAIRAGYHPLGLVRALQKIEAHQREEQPAGSGDVPVYFRTHPLTEERVRALRSEARELGYDVYVPGDPVTEALRRMEREEIAP